MNNRNLPPKFVPFKVRPIISSIGEIVNPLLAKSTPTKTQHPQPTVTHSIAAFWKVQ